MSNVKALCFDTGGTILDWHTGMRTALAAVGARHGIERDWARLANEFRRRSLKLIVNHGEHAPATMTFDDAHRDALDQVLADNGLGVFSEQERRTLWWDTIHGLKCWPDFPDSLARLRGKFMCVSFTLLSFRIVMDTARQNGISWDAVISCEAIGKYKVLPEAYKTCARYLQLDPSYGRLPQFRSQCRQSLRLPDSLRAPTRRMGRGRAARSGARSAARHRRRKLP